jgi:hypothetical protein
VEYLLTPFGSRFMAIIDEVRRLQEAVDNDIFSDSGEIQNHTTRAGRPTSRRS